MDKALIEWYVNKLYDANTARDYATVKSLRYGLSTKDKRIIDSELSKLAKLNQRKPEYFK